MIPGMYEDWRIQVTPSEEEVLDAESEGLAPYGSPASRVFTLTNHDGILTFQDDFEQSMLQRENVTKQHENTKIKERGSNDIRIPDGYAHMLETVLTVTENQTAEKGVLFKHADMSFTYREIVSPEDKKERVVHVDPPRRDNRREDEGYPVAKDKIFFASNKAGEATITQSDHVIEPSITLNKMCPEAMMEAELMQQAGAFEVWEGDEDTYHVQASHKSAGNVFVRIIVSMPGVNYFHNLSDEEKRELPEDFKNQHGIKETGAETAPDLIH